MMEVFGLSILQRLLNICCHYAAEHEIVLNRKKTADVVSPPKSINSVLQQLPISIV